MFSCPSSSSIHLLLIMWCCHVCTFLLALMFAFDRHFQVLMWHGSCAPCVVGVEHLHLFGHVWYLYIILYCFILLWDRCHHVEMGRNHSKPLGIMFLPAGCFWGRFWSIAISYVMSTSCFFDVRWNPRTGWRDNLHQKSYILGSRSLEISP